MASDVGGTTAPGLTVGSLFSGIGGFDLGLERAGMKVIWQVENNPFRKKILKRHWPDVELRDDIRTDTNGLERPDVICGGFPCQDVSVAGGRQGLDGERSGLWYEYIRLVRELRPTWVLIENVPGLLSQNAGKDFEIVVSGLAASGYGVAWRVLDSQYFGVPQRRRRVFIVGHLGAPCPIEVLFERKGGEGDTQTERASEKDIDHGIRASSERRGPGDDGATLIPSLSRTIHTDGHRNDTPDIDTYIVAPIAGTLKGGSGSRGWDNGIEQVDGRLVVAPIAGTFTAGNRIEQVDGRLVVSAETDADRVRAVAGVPRRVDATPDGSRYAALGDAVTVPVIEWIGRRIIAEGETND